MQIKSNQNEKKKKKLNAKQSKKVENAICKSEHLVNNKTKNAKQNAKQIKNKSKQKTKQNKTNK